MRGVWGFALACLAGLALAACSGSTLPAGDDRPAQPDAVLDPGPELLDVVIVTDRGQEDLAPADGNDATATPDELPGEAGEDGVEPDAETIEPGKPGAPCKINSECNSGFCLEAYVGRACAGECIDNCPTGTRCHQVQPPPDTVFACVYAFARLCQPCSRDTDCQVDYVPGVSACVTTDRGGFCGTSCGNDEDCPEGYGCLPAKSAAGVQTNQCTLLEGECACSVKSASQSLSTPCWASNGFGRCQGIRTCSAEGAIGECNARTPAIEICDGIDNDCNSFTDDIKAEPCIVPSPHGSCPGTKACAAGKDTCLGIQATAEQCNFVDDDCDGQTDEMDAIGCKAYYRDGDGDNHGVTLDSKCLCGPSDPYRTTVAGDCADGDADVNPGRTEVCGNGKDDNCKDGTDEAGAEGCETWFRDADGDQYGLSTDSRCLCLPASPYSASLGGDCNDLDGAVHPNASETCNNKDDDCDKTPDPEGTQGCTPFHYDGDVDGFGTDKRPARCLCTPDYATRYTSQSKADCNDNDQQVSPGKLEVCGNGIDDNCNGATDEPGAQGCINRWVDDDSDSFGGGDPLCTCSREAPYSAEAGGDCADQDPTRNPGVPETCGDSIDNNCDGNTDEEGAVNCQNRWYDGDGDLFGPDDPKCLCAPSGWYTAPAGGDCDDLDPTLNPGIAEACGDGIDNNCNGFIDEEDGVGCTTWFYDGDRDGFGGLGTGRCLCAKKGFFDSKDGRDCDDTNLLIHPGADEACGNGVDEDCDGLADEGGVGCLDYYFDGDRDGYGSDSRAPLCQCGPDVSGRYDTLQAGDCDDTNSAVHPGIREVCDAAGQPQRDDDCDGLLNEQDAVGCGKYYYDGDRDGHGNPEKERCYCAGGNPALKYDSPYDDDCNDLLATVSGGLPELCGDGLDNDCDGLTNEEGGQGCSRFYRDSDLDDFGVTADYKCLCVADSGGLYTTLEPGDCDDRDAEAHPGGRVCGKDGDCDGTPLDSGEACDDGNSISWDGCTTCVVSELQVNVTVSDDQIYPSVAALTGGGYVVAFQTLKYLTYQDIGARLLKADGTPESTSEIAVNSTTSSNQQAPSVAALANGGFVVTWESSGQDLSGWGIYGQRFTAAGAKSGGEFLVNGTTASDQRTPTVGAFADGRIVVAWQSSPQDGHEWGVYARRIKADGLPDGAEILVNETTAGTQDLPALAALPDGRFIVAWQGVVNRGSSQYDRDIFMRRFDANGAPDGGEVVVNQVTASDQSFPSIALVGSDSYVIAWQSSLQDGSGSGVYARRFALDGTPLGDEFRVNVYVAGDQGDPSVAGAPNGTFAIAWRSNGQDLDGGGIYLQRYVAAGTPTKGEFRANTYTIGVQSTPAIAATDASFLAGWSSENQDGSSSGVFSRLFGW